MFKARLNIDPQWRAFSFPLPSSWSDTCHLPRCLFDADINILLRYKSSAIKSFVQTQHHSYQSVPLSLQYSILHSVLPSFWTCPSPGVSKINWAQRLCFVTLDVTGVFCRAASNKFVLILWYNSLKRSLIKIFVRVSQLNMTDSRIMDRQNLTRVFMNILHKMRAWHWK